MKNKKANRVQKRPYEKPALRVLNIGAGVQTLGIGCKLINSRLGISNNPCTPGSPCVSTQGS
jgi:hypothetical protein